MFQSLREKGRGGGGGGGGGWGESMSRILTRDAIACDRQQ